MEMRKSGKGSLAAPILIGMTTLIWTAAAAHAQVATPTTTSGLGSTLGGTSFGGGYGISGGGSFSGGMSLTGTSLSGGGTSGAGSFTGSSSTGATGTNSWRSGFSGTWVGNLTGGGSYGGLSSGANTASGLSGTGTVSAFYPYYANPLAAGAPNLTKMPQFNQPISGGSTTGSLQGGYSGGFGSFGGGIGGGFNGLGANNNYSFVGGNNSGSGNLSANSGGYGAGSNNRRAVPYYTTSPAFDYRPAGPNIVQSEVQGMLTRSTSLSPNRDIRVAVEGPAVVLRGNVASEQDRHLAESLVRLSPGVHEVRNELTVTGSPPQPGPGP